MKKAIILAALSATALAFFQLNGRADAFEAYAGGKGIDITVVVGSPSNGPATRAAQNGEQVNVSVTRPAYSLFSLSSRSVTINAAPGSTVDLPCVSTATFTNGTHTLLAGFAQNFSGYSGTFAASSSSYYAVDQATNTKRSGNAVLNTTPNNLTETTVGLESNGTFCVGLHVVVPATAAPGKYYNTLDLQATRPTGLPNPTPAPTVTPLPTATPTATPLPTPTPTATPCSPSRDLFVTTEMSSGVGGILAFPPETNGNLAPQFTISGTNTGLVTPEGIVSDANGNLFVASTTYSNGGIAVFPCGSQGNVLTQRYISNSNLRAPSSIGLDSSDNIYVTSNGADGGTYSVLKFAAGANGDSTPVNTIPMSSPSTKIAVAPDGTLYIADQSVVSNSPLFGQVRIYGPGATTPSSLLGGPTDNIGTPWDVKLDGYGNIYTLSNDNYVTTNPRIMKFAAGSSGDAPAVSIISGPLTELVAPNRIWVDASGGVFVLDNANTSNATVYYFAPGESGNVAPTTVLSGSSTFLDGYGANGIGM